VKGLELSIKRLIISKGINKVFTSKIEEIPEEDSKYVDGSFDVSRFPNEYKAPVSFCERTIIIYGDECY
jgi:hypothetical protein